MTAPRKAARFASLEPTPLPQRPGALVSMTEVGHFICAAI
jgi:hypothetical protein